MTSAGVGFSNNASTGFGLYRIAENELGVATNGSNRLTIGATGDVAVSGPDLTVNGAQVATLSGGKVPLAQLPVATLDAAGVVELEDCLTSTSTTLALTANQGRVLNNDISGKYSGNSILAAASGSVTATGIRFHDNVSNGFGLYRVGENVLGFATAGVHRMSINSTGGVVISGNSLTVGGNSVAVKSNSGMLPADDLPKGDWTDGDVLYWDGSSGLIRIMSVGGGGIYTDGSVILASPSLDTPGTPGLSFDGNSTTGFYAIFGAGDTVQLGVAVEGSEAMRVDSSGNVTVAGSSLVVGGNHVSVKSNEGMIPVGDLPKGTWADTEVLHWDAASGRIQSRVATGTGDYGDGSIILASSGTSANPGVSSTSTTPRASSRMGVAVSAWRRPGRPDSP